MTKNIKDFVSSHNGKTYGSGQCYAGAEEYLSWGLDRTVTVPGYGTAWAWGQAWQSTILGSCCKLVSDRQDGDILFWNNHVCISYQGQCFGQNQGTNGSGGPFNLMYVGITPQIILRPNFISNLSWVVPTENRGLSQAEMENNAKCLYGYLHNVWGWSLNACAGVLGNCQVESSINPNRSEIGGTGYGLVQWTPGTTCKQYLETRQLTFPDDYGNGQCDLINTGSGYYATTNYKISFDAFKTSTADPSYLALAFLANFERPANSNQPIRGTYANNWYNYLVNWEPETPNGANGIGDTLAYVQKFQLELINGLVKSASIVDILVDRANT